MPSYFDKVSVFCFLASYCVAFGLEMVRLKRRMAIGRWVGFGFGVAGFLAQTAYLLVRSRGTENLNPLLSSTHDWMLVLAWIVVLMSLFLTLVDRELAVGLFLLPVVLLFVGSSYFVSKETNPLIEGSRGLAMLHATMLVIGIAGVVASFVMSVMYLVQHRRLKQHHAQQPGVLLPSLARLARWNWWGVVISVPLLTLGLGSGVALGLKSKKAAATLSFVDPIVIGYGIVWLVMMSLFTWLLTTRRSTGKQVAALTLWAGGFLLVMLIGLQVLTGEGLSSFHGGAKAAQIRSHKLPACELKATSWKLVPTVKQEASS
ncbi:MAG: cytochrome c biogenesis protein CcsA [Planctomycetia bacterium]|nr:cytochrome c biogenesis protein CcsA [Planctomycetia bacterium]